MDEAVADDDDEEGDEEDEEVEWEVVSSLPDHRVQAPQLPHCRVTHLVIGFYLLTNIKIDTVLWLSHKLMIKGYFFFFYCGFRMN